MPYSALRELRVLEVGAGIAGSYCAKLLADVGAQVVRVDDPDDDDPVGRLPPMGGPHGEHSVSFAYLSSGKESVVAGPDDVAELVDVADVLLTSSTAGRSPDPERSRTRNPRLVYVDITPFGTGGPYSRLPDAELLVDALGGWLYGIGEPGREPVKPPGWQSAVLAGTVAASAALGGYLAARQSGVGDLVEVSKQAAVTWFLMNPTTVYSYSGSVWRRDGGASPTNYPQGLMRCRDGFISVNVMYFAEWDRFCTLLDRPNWKTDPRLATPLLRLRNREVIDAVLRPWLAARTAQQAYAEAQSEKLPFSVVNTPATLHHSAQLAARGFWQTPDHPVLGPVTQPGTPFLMSDTPARDAAPAPVRGSRQVGEIRRRWSGRASGPGGGDSAVSLPLRGVRIVDLSMAWAGPLATRVLAELGAEVIKVESAGHMDRWRGGTSPQRGVERYPDGVPGARPWNRNAFFNSQNYNKKSLVLDLKTAGGRRLLLDLVSRSSMVVENFGSGAMGRLGLDYPRLREVRPDLVMLSMPAFGRTGPESGHIAHGPTIEAAAGNVSLQGYAGGDALPSGAFAWGDPVAGVTGAYAALVGLTYRAMHGTGCHLDLSHLESGIPFNFAAMVDYSANGRLQGPMGNVDPLAFFQAVLPCAGSDRWVAVLAQDRAATDRLGELAGRAVDGGRAAALDGLDAAMGGWTAGRTMDDVVATLGAVTGVACVPVHDAPGLIDDPGLREMGLFRALTHPEAGTHTYTGMPFRYRAREWRSPSPAPSFGADTADVLADVLGLRAAEIETLYADGVTAAEPRLQGD